MKGKGNNSEFMHYRNSTIWYWPLWGLCCPLYPLPTQQSCDCLLLRKLSTYTPLEKPFCAPLNAQPDCFQRNTGSTLRVMPTLMCARVTSLDSAQALPKYREGSGFSPSSPTAGVTLPRPPLRVFTPKNPTKKRTLPGLSTLEYDHQGITEIQ